MSNQVMSSSQLVDWNVVSSTHRVDGYNISSLVDYFGNVTRYATNFRPLTNATLFEGKQYAQSMSMYAVMAAIGLLIGTIVLILFCCLNVMFRSAPNFGKKAPPNRSFNLCALLLFVFAIVGAATFVIGFVGETKFHKGADNICDTVDFVFGRVDNIKINSDLILEETNVTKLMSDLEYEMQQAESIVAQIPTVPDEIKQQITQYNDYFNRINSQVKQSEDTIRNRIKLNILDEALRVMTTAHKECPHVTKSLEAVNIAVLIAFACFSLLFIVGLCSNCVRSLACGVGFLVMTMIAAFGTAAFITLIAGSDFCLTSKKVLVNYIETPMTDYYLYCHKNGSTNSTFDLTSDEYFDNSWPNIPKVPHMPNMSSIILNIPVPTIPNIPQIPHIPMHFPTLPPLPQIPTFPTNPEQIDELFHQVQHFLNQSKWLIVQLEQGSTKIIFNWCNLTQSVLHLAPVQDLCKHIGNIDKLLVGDVNRNITQDSLLTRLDKVSTTVGAILRIVDCSGVTPEIDGTLSNACTTLYESFFLFLLNSIFAFACFYILLLISIWMIYKAKAEKDDTYLPSAPSSAHLSQYMREFSWSKAQSRSDKTTVL